MTLMLLKVAIVIIAGIVAIGAFHQGVETDFQPQKRTRTILFCTGFFGMLAIAWLMLPAAFGENWWLTLIGSVILGGFWAFTAPKRWRFIQAEKARRDHRSSS